MNVTFRSLPAAVVLALMAVLMLCGACRAVGQSAAQPTLETLCDQLKVPEVRFAPASFSESCALLEATLRQALVNAPQQWHAAPVAARISLWQTVSPPGAQAFLQKDATLRELLQHFASTWHVTVTLTGNTITLAPSAAQRKAPPPQAR